MDTRTLMVDIGGRLWRRNMLAAADGNLSVRREKDILITPSGRPLAFLAPQEIVAIDETGAPLAEGRPSGETLMHLEVYRRCPPAQAVAHAHPPCAIAWSAARPDLRELPADCLSEVILACGRIPILPYATPGPELAAGLGEEIEESRVSILASHGALSWGESLEEAWMGLERLEHAAQILLLAESLGGARPLPPQEIAKLWTMRGQMGGGTR